MSDVTRILRQMESGDPSAADQLLPLVYEELRKLAAARLSRESPGQTLQATALVHEAYLRLVAGGDARGWDSRGHFFAAAAEAMRRILVNRARDKRRLKRGGGQRRVDFELAEVPLEAPDEDLVALDEALTSLAALDPRKGQVVELRFFGGLSNEEVAEALGISRATVQRDLRLAKAWLNRELKNHEEWR